MLDCYADMMLAGYQHFILIFPHHKIPAPGDLLYDGNGETHTAEREFFS
ncbi:hypothetical protein BN2127_JRS9_00656 [Bacillus subtilis]|nr:hypothetical protein BN2127_JRS2_01155 [Bacillus subtilis]CUB46670.1 hypothetical protein BN2127_JRS11_00107 [Bacillus subtilis]CUB53409.1 hypothetical protein BN2127_JRS9_00656 [Bacillus subtilis]